MVLLSDAYDAVDSKRDKSALGFVRPTICEFFSPGCIYNAVLKPPEFEKSLSFGETTAFRENAVSYAAIFTVALDANRFIIFYPYGQQLARMVLRNPTTGALSFSSQGPVVVSGTTGSLTAAIKIDTDKILISTYNGSLVVVTTSDDQITPIATHTSVYTENVRCRLTLLESNKVLASFGKLTSVQPTGLSRVVTVTGTTVSINTVAAFQSSGTGSTSVAEVKALSATKALLMYGYSQTPLYLYLRVVNISGTTVTYGSNTTLVTGSGNGNINVINSDQALISFNHTTSDLKYASASISGNTITLGTERTLRTAEVVNWSLTKLIEPNRVLCTYKRPSDSNTYSILGSYNFDEAISLGDEITLGISTGDIPGVLYYIDKEQLIYTYRASGTSYGTYTVATVL